jgi:hypothetical protein
MFGTVMSLGGKQTKPALNLEQQSGGGWRMHSAAGAE